MNFKQWLKTLPVPMLPALVGVLTLSNVFNGLGFTWVRHIFMVLCGALWICATLKVIDHPQQFKEEYNHPILCALYAGWSMCLMIFSQYIAQFSLPVAKVLWLIAVTVHIIHIMIFTIKHAFAHFKTHFYVPAWFVTYNGLAVAVVIGDMMGFLPLQKMITWYCIGIYLFLLPTTIKRLLTHPFEKAVYHTQAIIIAPVSLSLVTYLKMYPEPFKPLVYLLYGLLLLSLLFYFIKLPSFLAFSFMPSFAGITFPMAIGVVASASMVQYFNKYELVKWAYIAEQIRGIQLYLATCVIGYVFIRMMISIFGVDVKIAKAYEA
ncbi:TDT family transporter [Dolosicoccus paucivorans]|uniref:TDT family transporter n=1 Tax=Dolosicoccus paucivorans TaxID=84521 RepID=UPI000888EEE5|nr:TDT family transporter [Dolosicoccus paucivorans]SDI33405.1 exfoliative toxin A/B [Dolosicoccus paucivorans]